ncbi:MAG: hypothetical protein KKA55_10655 [Proteobacteria bacterium]|nr:hypothetical protein [Pseudomonadota bacterium]MBU1595979.1 hypothetical protein [Pseudomonadota bacterium]
MKKIIFSLATGAAAGIVDVVPMLLQGLDVNYSLSAFVQWLVAGFVINHMEFGLRGWLKGLVVAELLALPILVLMSKADASALAPIVAMSAILGSLVGFASERHNG